MKKYFLCLILALFASQLTLSAQTDAYLRELTQQVVGLRVPLTNKAKRNKAVLELSAPGKPKITLMDDAATHANEYKAKHSQRFLLNKVVIYAHERQNTGLSSKGEYFNSQETGVHYSAVEKCIPRGKTVSYTLTGHAGQQEFSVISFNPKTKFQVTVRRNSDAPIVKDAANGCVSLVAGKASRTDELTISVSNLSTNKEDYDAFVILNHNPQK